MDHDFATLHHPLRPDIRFRYATDDDYRTVGSYSYGSEAENREVEDFEIEKLESGEWTVVTCTVQERCDQCGEWADRDSMGGIVIESDDETMLDYALASMHTPDEQTQENANTR